jgi:two-component system, NtrC family, sensor kinase
MTITWLPVIFVDVAGALLMILFSILSIRHVWRLNSKDPDNFVWTYLLWVCFCLAGFAISRSAGHILKQGLLVSGYDPIWEIIRPVSGSVNTMLLVVVAAVTLFFNRAWQIYQGIFTERRILRTTQAELMRLNETLENRVQERTESLLVHEKRMAQTDRLASIGQLSSGIAHELNNPLGVIQGYTQLLLRGEDESSQKYQDLQVILKHARNCKAIVEDLLNFARHSQPEKTQINIHDVIDDVLVFIKHRDKMEKIRMETRYDKNMASIFMDEKKIKQVFLNLLMNARHAVGGEGLILISTAYSPEERQVKVSITDDGYGIEEKNIVRIFDPFFTTKSTGEGTGLGLAVSYGIIKTHGGEIQVSSEPGKGSTFTVVLPVNQAVQPLA